MAEQTFSTTLQRRLDDGVQWGMRHWLLLVNSGAILYAGLPWLSPLATASGYPLLGEFLFRIYKPLCHQLPERSFFVCGHQVGFCHRCVAMYSAIVVAGLLFGLLRRRIRPISLKIGGLLLLPILIDGLTHMVDDLSRAGPARRGRCDWHAELLAAHDHRRAGRRRNAAGGLPTHRARPARRRCKDQVRRTIDIAGCHSVRPDKPCLNAPNTKLRSSVALLRSAYVIAPGLCTTHCGRSRMPHTSRGAAPASRAPAPAPTASAGQRPAARSARPTAASRAGHAIAGH